MSDGAEPEPMLTTAQLARVLAVSVRTVTRYVASGVLTPTLTLPGGHWRWRETDVQTQLRADRSAGGSVTQGQADS